MPQIMDLEYSSKGLDTVYIEDDNKWYEMKNIVRCKDCSVPHNKYTGCPYLNGIIPDPNFYCARGEHK